MTNVDARFNNAGLKNLGQLYKRAQTIGLRDCGSSSINSRFTSAVEDVKSVMKSRAGVRPSNEQSAAMWAEIGDRDATFYFSGYRTIDGSREFVNTSLYLEILLEHISEIPHDSLIQLDELAKIFGGSIRLDDLEIVELKD